MSMLRRWPAWLGLLLMGSMLWTERTGWMAWAWAEPQPHAMVLLLPDSRALMHPVTQAWLDAAKEEGLALQPMTSDRFVQAVARRESISGVLVPDTVHPQASDIWVQALDTYVRRGGHALISHDAAIHALHQQRYAAPTSRLSGLVGFRYALYDTLQHDTMALGPVLASREAEQALAILPGKIDFPSSQAEWGELTTYGYAHLHYPYFRSEGPVQAKVWLRSAGGDPIVSTHTHGQGSVLFCNLPLGYLKTRTDGYWLHRLLGHFATRVLEQPVLSTVPQGMGGLVLNLHVDSNAAERPMLELEEAGWFEQGPFSIHVTAGPDTYRLGDGLGLDMRHNLKIQALLRRLHAQGHEIGNHGGWNHNVFGEQVNEHNAQQFEPWLALNQQTLSSIVGQTLRTYSAPMGNQPGWATDWLRRHRFKAYYSPGNNGMGPTRSYHDGQPPSSDSPWAFPITHYLRVATLDELPPNGLAEGEMQAFIAQLLDYTATQGVARLFYFHPAAAPDFRRTLERLQKHASRLRATGRWRWYGMQELAEFMTRRQALQWRFVPAREGSQATLSAHSGQSLQGMTWVFAPGTVRGLHLSDGHADISEQPDGGWHVTAGDVRQLTLHWQQLTSSPPQDPT